MRHDHMCWWAHQECCCILGEREHPTRTTALLCFALLSTLYATSWRACSRQCQAKDHLSASARATRRYTALSAPAYSQKRDACSGNPLPSRSTSLPARKITSLPCSSWK